MAKMYTVDGKMLVEKNAVQVGDKIYAVDDRLRTVKKIQAVTGDDADRQILELALGKAAIKELDIDNMRFPVFSALISKVMAAMTDEDEAAFDARFRAAVKSAENE